jgi:hypothetical protein
MEEQIEFGGSLIPIRNIKRLTKCGFKITKKPVFSLLLLFVNDNDPQKIHHHLIEDFSTWEEQKVRYFALKKRIEKCQISLEQITV